MSPTQGFPVGVVLHNPAVERNVAAFSKLSFAVKLLTTAVMVDNLAEMVDKCLLNQGY